MEVGITHKDYWTVIDDKTKVMKDDDIEEIDKLMVGGKKPDKGNGENGSTGVVDAATTANAHEAKNDNNGDNDDDCVLKSWTKRDDVDYARFPCRKIAREWRMGENFHRCWGYG